MTRADKIRSMSDEQLHALVMVVKRDGVCKNIPEEWCASFSVCPVCIAAWLEQEVHE